MHSARLDRLADGSGLLATLLVIVGFVVSVAAGRAELTLASTREEVGRALAEPVGAGLWAGLALESVGLLAIAVFGAALAARVGGRIGYAVAGTAVTFTAVSLVAVGAIVAYERNAGSEVDAAVAHAFVTLAGVLYVGTWLIGAILLALAAASGVYRRWMSWSALAIAALSLAALLAPTNEAAQLPAFLQLLWLGAASIALLRRKPSVLEG